MNAAQSLARAYEPRIVVHSRGLARKVPRPAGGPRYPTAVPDEVRCAGRAKMSFDSREPHIAIGDELVELLHEEAFGEHGQPIERGVFGAAVECSVERRAFNGEGAQLAELARVVDPSLVSCPTVVRSQLRSLRGSAPRVFRSMQPACPVPIAVRAASGILRELPKDLVGLLEFVGVDLAAGEPALKDLKRS